jgi:Protein of unknown function (DUF3349)
VIGATLAAAGGSAIKWHGLTSKVIIPAALSPIIAALVVRWNVAGRMASAWLLALPCSAAVGAGWLRAGYPEGVPDVDYIPLFALLGSQLTNDEVNAIAQELETTGNPQSAEAIKHAIAAVTDHHEPKDSDVARVRAPGWRRGLAARQARAFRPGALAVTRPDRANRPPTHPKPPGPRNLNLAPAVSTWGRRIRRAAPPPRAGPPR